MNFYVIALSIVIISGLEFLNVFITDTRFMKVKGRQFLTVWRLALVGF